MSEAPKTPADQIWATQEELFAQRKENGRLLEERQKLERTIDLQSKLIQKWEHRFDTLLKLYQRID